MRRRQPAATLDDVIELLAGIGQITMGISVRLDEIIAILREDDERDDA